MMVALLCWADNRNPVLNDEEARDILNLSVNTFFGKYLKHLNENDEK